MCTFSTKPAYIYVHAHKVSIFLKVDGSHPGPALVIYCSGSIDKN